MEFWSKTAVSLHRCAMISIGGRFGGNGILGKAKRFSGEKISPFFENINRKVTTHKYQYFSVPFYQICDIRQREDIYSVIDDLDWILL
jgi:hypothetical protein